jgi:hypothetical protein
VSGRRAALGLVLGLVAVAALAPAAARGQAPAAPGRFAASAEVRGCALELAHPAPSDDTLRLRTGCPLSLAELLQGVDRLLATAGPALPAPATLMMGRIVEYPWLAERLARAALADPGWDAARGRPRAGHENRWVADTLEQRRLLSELADRFAAEGLALRVAGVEKVLVGAVASAPELRGLAADGVDPAARLPFDAQLWLRIER